MSSSTSSPTSASRSSAERPADLSEEVFVKAFEMAKIARFEPTERKAYENSLKHYRDLKNVEDTARGEGYDEGKEEGHAEGHALGLEQGIERGVEQGIEQGIEQGAEKERKQLVQIMHQQGLSPEQIAQFTGMSVDAVTQLL